MPRTGRTSFWPARWRHVQNGVYVDVGGWDPDEDSVTRLFYDRGWRGVDIEPIPELAEKFRQRRPRDEVVEAAITDDPDGTVTLHRFGTSGLSTLDDDIARRHIQAGLDHDDLRVPARRLDDVLDTSSLVGGDIHFLKIDVEGIEDKVLKSIDLARWRPWVMVIEATGPNSSVTTHEKWESAVLAAGYRFTLFDGLSRFYVSAEHPELTPNLSYPACALDGFELARLAELKATAAKQEHELGVAQSEALRWRHEAVNYWANAVSKAQASEEAARQARGEAARVRGQLRRVRGTLTQVRADRKRLRGRVERMTLRIERLEERSAGGERAGGRLGAVLKRVRSA